MTSCQPLVLVNLGTEKMYSGAAVDGVASILRAAANVSHLIIYFFSLFFFFDS